jgi:hypothetical protein
MIALEKVLVEGERIGVVRGRCWKGPVSQIGSHTGSASTKTGKSLSRARVFCQ